MGLNLELGLKMELKFELKLKLGLQCTTGAEPEAQNGTKAGAGV